MPAVARRRAGNPDPEVTRPPARSASAARPAHSELGLALEQDPAEQDEPHDGRAQHGGLRAYHEGEAHQRGRRDSGRHAARDTDHAERREDRCRDQRHVEARHGQHVVHAGAPERVIHLAGQRRALAEEQAGQERGRALGQRAADSLHRPAFQPCRPGRGIGGERSHAVRAPAAHQRDALAAEWADRSRPVSIPTGACSRRSAAMRWSSPSAGASP